MNRDNEDPEDIDDVLRINKDREERGLPGRWSVYDVHMNNDDPEFEYFYNPYAG